MYCKLKSSYKMVGAMVKISLILQRVKMVDFSHFVTFWHIHSEMFQIARNNNKKHLKRNKDNFTMTYTLRQNNVNPTNCTFFLLLDYYINCCKWWKCQSLRFRLKFRKRKQDRKCTCAAPPPHILLLFPNSGQKIISLNLKKYISLN